MHSVVFILALRENELVHRKEHLMLVRAQAQLDLSQSKQVSRRPMDDYAKLDWFKDVTFYKIVCGNVLSQLISLCTDRNTFVTVVHLHVGPTVSKYAPFICATILAGHSLSAKGMPVQLCSCLIRRQAGSFHLPLLPRSGWLVFPSTNTTCPLNRHQLQ